MGQGVVSQGTWSDSHLLAEQASVIGLENDVSVTGNVKTSALDLLDIGLVLVCGYDLLHLCWGDLSCSCQLDLSLTPPCPRHE